MGLLDFLFGSSDNDPNNYSDAGCTEETAIPLKRLLPFVVRYDDLEPDIKINLSRASKHNGMKSVTNYRTMHQDLPMGLGDYLIGVDTTMEDGCDDMCVCTYVMMMNARLVVMYNLYDILEKFLIQIREKTHDGYVYHINKEVVQKMPTFCALYKQSENPDKLMITFIDDEKKYPILAQSYTYEFFESRIKDINIVHKAMFKKVDTLITEVQNTGLLNQSKMTLLKNVIRIGRVFSGF